MYGQGMNWGVAKWRQVVASRKVWAGLLGLVITLGLWGLGEIDGAQAVAAMAWVLGIFMGAVAVEDGLRNVLSGMIEPAPMPPRGEPRDAIGKDDGYGAGASIRR